MATYRVGMAEYKAAKAPAIIITLGLGSCVGVALFDEKRKVGGLAHVMLPDSSLAGNKTFNPGKFADTAIDTLIEDMIRLGGDPNRTVAKIAGGAQMFQIKSENQIMQIGRRNVEAVKNKLKQLNICTLGEDVEGNYGRTVELDCSTGILTVKTIGRGIKTI